MPVWVASVRARCQGPFREQDVAFQHHLLEHIPQGLDSIVGLKDPTGLGGPGDHGHFPLKDRVLPVQRMRSPRKMGCSDGYTTNSHKTNR
ncbi:MAG: hypothetical protein JRJ69_04545 [Deltaproteobacteria bacterium]|nr:hypothetical protein [Deltaproteobacteria bacterium]